MNEGLTDKGFLGLMLIPILMSKKILAGQQANIGKQKYRSDPSMNVQNILIIIEKQMTLAAFHEPFVH